jgi:hypothetical protein
MKTRKRMNEVKDERKRETNKERYKEIKVDS